MKSRLWIPLVLLLLFPVPVVLLTHRTLAGSGRNGELLMGVQALDGFLEEAHGRPVLINFWATWCGPCVRELPELEELAGEFGNDAVFVAVDLGDPDISTLQTFRENDPVGLTVVWLDPEEARAVSERYSLPDVLPVTIVLDRNGDETARAMGARSREWFVSALRGASSGVEAVVVEGTGIHVYVVGTRGDPLVDQLIVAAVELAGEDGYDLLDPSVPSDSIRMEEVYLPMHGWPYAQLCVGGACRPPVGSPEELRAVCEGMQ